MSDIYQRVNGSWDHYDFVRHIYYEAVFAILEKLEWPPTIDMLEVGAREPTTPVIRMMKNLLGDRCHEVVGNYPEVDIQQTGYASNSWDMLVADQVLEHVRRPWLGADEIWRIVKPGGIIVIGTPFILPIHPNPLDCWRIAPDGYRTIFPVERWQEIELGSWGNMEIVRQAYNSPRLRGFGGDWLTPQEADAEIPAWKTPPDNMYPVVYWFVARKL